mgnify:CR=1 FL=1
MHATVTLDQFEVRDGLVLHKPTEAEFTPHPKREDSVLGWTGRIRENVFWKEKHFRQPPTLSGQRRIWRSALVATDGTEHLSRAVRSDNSEVARK